MTFLCVRSRPNLNCQLAKNSTGDSKSNAMLQVSIQCRLYQIVKAVFQQFILFYLLILANLFIFLDENLFSYIMLKTGSE